MERLLTGASDGKKKKPYIVFRGVGKNKHAKQLKEDNPEVIIGFSSSGWFNNDIVEDWLNQLFPDTCFFNRLLVWDSFRAHISDQTKEVLKRKRMHQALIPGGCTGVLQAPDVSWNKPFKQYIRAEYDKWLEHGTKSYTKQGNLRAMSKDDLCKMVAKAWANVSEEVIKKSFLVTGQSKDSSPSDISCLKEGRECHSALKRVEEMWDKPLEKLEKVDNPTETDETENEKNELVILDCADN